jgi:hypothetical protein
MQSIQHVDRGIGASWYRLSRVEHRKISRNQAPLTHRPFVCFSSIASPLITPPLPLNSSDESRLEGRSRAPKRYAFDDHYIWGLIRMETKPLLVSGLCLVLCTLSNLAAPVLSGQFLEAIVQQKPMEEIQKILSIMAFSYLLEPILTKVSQTPMLHGSITLTIPSIIDRRCT